MRSMEVEVMLGIPAEKAWEIYRDYDIINKINPEMLMSANTLKETVVVEVSSSSNLVQ
ncbi:hypothetical protein GBA52_010545 [Prunus armeniaca]|nr:hypothetical protein GBA52_010545 [Prunus armeniaca]